MGCGLIPIVRRTRAQQAVSAFLPPQCRLLVHTAPLTFRAFASHDASGCSRRISTLRQTFPRAALIALCVSTACSRGASSLQKTESPLAPSVSDLAVQATCRTITNNTGSLLLKQ